MAKQIDPETIILRKYKNPVLKILQDLTDKRLMTKTCREDLDGMQSSRISEILSGERELTFYYLTRFISGGIMDIRHILQGRKISDLPKADQEVFKRLSLDQEMIDLMYAAIEAGQDPEAIKTILRALSKT